MKARLFLIVLLLILPLTASAQRRRSTLVTADTITLGGLFSLTGDGASLGNASKAALELAARDINQEFHDLGLPWRVETIVEDTKLTPSIAAEKIRLLDERGATFVIGAQSSAEAGAVLSYVNENGLILISNGSTAFSLAIAGDNLFRLPPNDRLEGAALATLIRADGFDTLLPMWRDDTGNNGLRTGTTSAFTARGGTALTGVPFSPTTTDFTAAVTALGAQLRAAKAQNPSAKIAVLLASFEEAAAIFALARFDPDLSSVRWYGTDGVAQVQALLSPASVARFAEATQFTAATVGLDDAARDRWQPISDEIRARVGFTPDAFALSTYDAAWVAALSAVEVQLRPSMLRASFVRNVQRYWGLTGPTALDAAGDRAFASFDFWTVKEVNGQFVWVKTGQS